MKILSVQMMKLISQILRTLVKNYTIKSVEVNQQQDADFGKLISNQQIKWLQWVLEIERPHLVKRDNEGEALFRKFNDEEVYKHWSIGLRTRYTEHLKKLIGNGLNSARHTYTQNGQDIDIPTSKLQSSLGQVPNDRRGKSIRSYARDRVEELDPSK